MPESLLQAQHAPGCLPYHAGDYATLDRTLPARKPPTDDPLAEFTERLQHWLDDPRWARYAVWFEPNRVRIVVLAILAVLLLLCVARIGSSGAFVLFAALVIATAVGVYRDQRLAHGCNIALSIIAGIASPFLLVLGKLYAEREQAGAASAPGYLILLMLLLLAINAVASLIWLWQERKS